MFSRRLFANSGPCLFVATLLTSVAALPAVAQPIVTQAAKAPESATLIPLSENWRLDGDIPVNALLISLQGLANRGAPRVYLEYPQHWQWEIVRPLVGFLERRHGLDFERLAVNDADADPTNEIQALSLSGSTLSLSNGGGRNSTVF